MKKLIPTIIFLLTISITGYSQAFSNVFVDIGNKDLTSLAKKMSNEVELCIADSPEFYSKKEAIEKIYAFLIQKNVTDCKMIHSGKSLDKNSKYWVGKLISSNGNYRMFLYLESDEIIEIRLDNFKK